MLSRRDVLRAAGFAAAAGFMGEQTGGAAAGPPFLFFSKHLPDLGWAELGRAVREAGFDGVDLTVRPQGHVLPERAAADLPRAVEAIKAAGSTVPMVTTDLTSASNPAARPLLEAAARSGVRFFKTGYWRYSGSPDVRAQVQAAGEDLAGLAALARDCGIELGFHNHTAYIGAALWEIAPAMDRLEPKWAGYYFDPRHAVAEGGGGAYKAAMHLVVPRLKMMALKDFVWTKSGKGWHIENCPMGEGMVDWAWFSKVVRGSGFAGPISLHFEYEVPGATPEERTARMLEAAVKDLAVARRWFG
jgi:L-ribulose-5-phosphate 3-epimerase